MKCQLVVLILRTLNLSKIQGIIHIRPINILIGLNGVGKSNFISFFKLLINICKQRLRNFVDY